MSSGFERCKRCGEFDWKDKHTCAPVWQAMFVDYNDEDDPEETFGHDAEEAVEKYAQDNFVRWEYPEEMEIWVRRCRIDTWQKFIVGVESVPQFNVYPKKEK